MTDARKRRVLLKLSGESFGGGSLGVNPDVVSSLAGKWYHGLTN